MTTVFFSPEGREGMVSTTVPASEMVRVAASVSPVFSTTMPKRTVSGSLCITVVCASACTFSSSAVETSCMVMGSAPETTVTSSPVAMVPVTVRVIVSSPVGTYGASPS